MCIGKDFRQFYVDFLSSQITGNDGTIGCKKNDFGYGVDAVSLSSDLSLRY
jgi:hypothetical protein